MPLTTQDKIGLGSLGVNALGGLLGGLDDSDQKNADQNRNDEFFQLLLQALNNKSNTEQDIQGENLQRSMAFSSANPLGAENDYRKKNSLGFAGLDTLSNRTLARGTPNMASGFSSRPDVQQAFNPSNVDEAIRQRRIGTAGINPGAANQIGPNDFASQLFGDLQNSQNARRQNSQ